MHINADGCSLAGADIPPGRYFSCRYTYNRLSISAADSSSWSARRTSSNRCSRSSARRRCFSAPREVVDHGAAVHHDQPIAELRRLLHRVGHHQRRQVIPCDDGVAELDDLIGALGIEGGGVLVEQQQLGPQPGRHEQRQRLALAAGEAADRVVEPLLEPHVQRCARDRGTRRAWRA